MRYLAFGLDEVEEIKHMDDFEYFSHPLDFGTDERLGVTKGRFVDIEWLHSVYSKLPENIQAYVDLFA